MSSIPEGNFSDTSRLILEAATSGRHLTGDELQQVIQHVAQAGFDSTAIEDVGGRLVGLIWKDHRIRTGDSLPPAEVHYFRHVAVQSEWPLGTTYDEYLASLRDVILHPQTGFLINQFRDRGWQLTATRSSGSLQGPAGRDWIVIEYRLATGHWVTAFQPQRRISLFREARAEANNMATAATLRKVDANLQDIGAEIDYLPIIAEKWSNLSDSNQVSYLLEWDDLMDGLKFVARAYEAGDMTPVQQVRYKALLAKLKEYQTTIQRLELSVPKL